MFSAIVLLERVAEVIELVAALDLLAAALVLGLVLGRVLHHAVDVVLVEAARVAVMVIF